jgi:hypothetical protein
MDELGLYTEVMSADPSLPPGVEPALLPAGEQQPARNRRRGPWQTIAVVGGGIVLALFAGTPTARAAWQELALFLSLQGTPEPASANVLSEHEIEVLDQMSPQQQAELLLERSINHYQGANEQIAVRVAGWRGRITLQERLNNLFLTAINSDDLRVRAAGIEVDIAARNLAKSSATVDRLGGRRA